MATDGLWELQGASKCTHLSVLTGAAGQELWGATLWRCSVAHGNLANLPTGWCMNKHTRHAKTHTNTYYMFIMHTQTHV